MHTMKTVAVSISLAAIIVLGMIILLTGCAEAPRACTAEAKICPYGDVVGRTGTNCAFAPCAERCTSNDQCRTIYNTCFCEAVPIADPRQDLPLDPTIQCFRLDPCNTGAVTAVCTDGACVKSAENPACVQEGASLGAVVPGNTNVCCSGLVPVVPTDIVGTRGTCQKPAYTTQCDKDADCVRRHSCCDCGLGTWVNAKYNPDLVCDQMCECAIRDAVGVCENNTCVGKARPLA